LLRLEDEDQGEAWYNLELYQPDERAGDGRAMEEEVQESGSFTQGCVVVYAVGLAMIMVLITMAVLFTALLFGSGLVA
jgi:hypothetical protein